MTKNTAVIRENFWERNKKSGGFLLKKQAKKVSVSVIRAVLLFGMCFMILQPILNKISISFMAEEDLYNSMVISIPEHFTTANYQLANQFMDYWKTLGNQSRSIGLRMTPRLSMQTALATILPMHTLQRFGLKTTSSR